MLKKNNFGEKLKKDLTEYYENSQDETRAVKTKVNRLDLNRHQNNKIDLLHHKNLVPLDLEQKRFANEIL